MECDWCKNECDGSLMAYVDNNYHVCIDNNYHVCVICLNLLADQDYDALNERIESAPQICELKIKAKGLQINRSD